MQLASYSDLWPF